MIDPLWYGECMKITNAKNQKKTARKKAAVKQVKNDGAQYPAALRVKRSPLVRIKRMLELMQDGKYPNCSTIAEEMEVSLSTVGRDMEYMRDMLELPIE